jgi:co-chaperonin GroES (HSP10)
MIRPLRDRIVVRPLDEPESSVLHVVRFEEKHYRGEVIAIGPDVKWGTRIGDVIRFTDIFKFPVIMDRGVKCLILQEADIFGIEELEAA